MHCIGEYEYLAKTILGVMRYQLMELRQIIFAPECDFLSNGNLLYVLFALRGGGNGEAGLWCLAI